MQQSLYLVVLTGFITGSAALGVTLNQVDDFENGTPQGWSEGFSSPNPPANVATGGPAGANDNFLRNLSSGAGGAGGKLVMFNSGQWSGDYVSAGVRRIELDAVNLGATELNLRLAIATVTSQWVSDPAISLPTGSGWRHVSFDLSEAGLAALFPGGSLAEALTGVGELRILSSVNPSFNGDNIAGTLGVDNIRAAPEPGAMALAGLGSILVLRPRRRRGSN